VKPVYVGHLCGSTHTRPAYANLLLNFPIFVATATNRDCIILSLHRGTDKSMAFPSFLFAAQPEEFFLDGLKKLEQRSHKCVELRGNM
jgi:hypothetical protein